MSLVQELTTGILHFLRKLDWGSPYTYLGVLGAIGAPSTLFQAVRWLRSFWNTTFLRIRHPSILKDFYFKERDLGYRILENGETYLNVRRETIVSMKKDLESIPFNYEWSGSGEISERVEPTSVSIEAAPKIVGKTQTRRHIIFEKRLAKRQKQSYIIILTCMVRSKQPESFVSSSSSRRVDRLVLRVAFPVERRSAHVTYRVLDADGAEKSHESLECSDYLTGEFRKEIKYPKPFYEHRIEWE